mgnify:CR=1 FL=1
MPSFHDNPTHHRYLCHTSWSIQLSTSTSEFEFHVAAHLELGVRVADVADLAVR